MRGTLKAAERFVKGNLALTGERAAYGANGGRVALSPALARVVRAAKARERAKDDLTEAQRNFARVVSEAHEAGESYTAIGRVLGVTRQRVAQIIESGE